MKRLLLILPLLLMAAGDGEIEGWKVAQGNWSCAKSGEITGEGTGNLTKITGPIGDFDLDWQILLCEYTDSHNMAGISFRASDPARYKLSFRSPGSVTFDKTDASGVTMPLTTLPLSWPKGKWISVKLAMRGGAMKAQIGGKIKLEAADATPLPPGRLELSTFNATARFKIKKINVKDK